MAVYTTIDDPSAHHQAVTYTGGGNSSSVTFGGNSDLQLDWLWVKRRDSADNSKVFDTSRGIGSGSEPYLTTVSDEQEQTYGYLTSVNSDGFTWDTTDASVGASGNTYVAWGWKANGGTTTTNDASATGVGTIDSVYQANTTAGFSIVTWTGTGSAGTIAHGLGATPSSMIVKNRSKGAGESWLVYHHKNTSAPETDHLLLNTTGGTSDNDIAWNDTAPTSTVFSVKNDDSTNDSGETFVGYFFTEIQGYSKFGSYEGNSATDGQFIYTGFKPAWVLTKNISAAQSWWLFDNARTPYNGADVRLSINRNNAEDTGVRVDFVANGFKWRHGDNAWNYSGNTFVTYCVKLR